MFSTVAIAEAYNCVARGGGDEVKAYRPADGVAVARGGDGRTGGDGDGSKNRLRHRDVNDWRIQIFQIGCDFEIKKHGSTDHSNRTAHPATAHPAR